jgi:hypothetical protein
VLAAASDALVTTGGDALGFLSMDFFSNVTRLSQGQLRIHLKLICGVGCELPKMFYSEYQGVSHSHTLSIALMPYVGKNIRGM